MKYTRKNAEQFGIEVYGRGIYEVKCYDEENQKYNKTFKNYMNAYNYSSKLIRKNIYCGMDILEWQGCNLVNRGFIGC